MNNLIEYYRRKRFDAQTEYQQRMADLQLEYQMMLADFDQEQMEHTRRLPKNLPPSIAKSICSYCGQKANSADLSCQFCGGRL